MRDRRMTVHDEAFMASRVVEELVTNPNQIVGILIIEWNARPNACMYEQEIATTELIAQALHEQFVSARKCIKKAAMQAEGCLVFVQLDAVRRERLHAAQWQPVLQNGRILKEPFHHGLVVATQANRAIGNQPNREQIDHRFRLRTAINVVAEINLDRMRDRSA